MRSILIYYIVTILIAMVLFSASSCEGNDPIINTPEEEAARILANTPTELPPITMTGENTMGAWIIPQPGSELHQLAGQDSILFVASGVERIDPIGASSTDCDAFQNFRYESDSIISIIGRWCSRPEIGDSREQVLSFAEFDSGEIVIRYSMDLDGGRSTNRIKYRNLSALLRQRQILLDDRDNRIFSGEFETTLFHSENENDSILVRNARFDARYGITP